MLLGGVRAQSLDHLARRLERAAGQQHGELVAIVSRQHVLCSQLAIPCRGCLPEQPVTGLVAVGVIYHFEVVEVNDGETQRLCQALRAGKLADECRLERPAVRQACEGIGVRKLGSRVAGGVAAPGSLGSRYVEIHITGCMSSERLC